MIPFNKPFISGKEIQYIVEAFEMGKLSGNGIFTKKCQDLLRAKYRFEKTLLTTSCTDALEICAMLAKIEPGDEVIIPSYTFVSTALAFVREGAKIIFADSYSDNPNIDPSKIEALVTERTRAIIPVHYAGVACDMDAIMDIASRHNLLVIEDAAQAIDSYYKGRPLGTIGHLAAFSFHETKNIIAGEGGLLVINDPQFVRRAEILWEKGTNRAEFFRGEINKYGWVDTGSSFLPSDIVSAFLYAQLERIEEIQAKRKMLWNEYWKRLYPMAEKGYFKLLDIPDYATCNAHMFYIICHSLEIRSALIAYLKGKGISTVFHYLSLHKSDYYKTKHDGRILINSDNFTDLLLRLPLYYELTIEQLNFIAQEIECFFKSYNYLINKTK